ncbi:MAG: hypothetical protein ABI947_01830 [Chloroflexota bacterium]
MRRGGLSIVIALIGVALGIGAGLLYAWRVDPQVQFDTNPWQLTDEGQRQYMIAVSLAYSKDHDLIRTANRLVVDLRLGDRAWQTLADTACDLARSSYVSTNTGFTAVRSMVELARSQGATSCASTLMPLTSTPAPTPTVVTVTPSLIPPSTKTPTPTLGATFTPATQPPPIDSTATPSGDFRLALVEPYCNPKRPGLIEINVQDANGVGIPAIPVEVNTGEDKDDFFTGLKTERGPGYADYQMTAGGSYVVSLPGASDRSTSLEAIPCNVAVKDGGGKAVVSYRVTFRRAVGS